MLRSQPWPPRSSAWSLQKGTAPASQSLLHAKEKHLLQGQDTELNSNFSIRNNPSVHPRTPKNRVPVI